jgi:hypothetical protein
VSLKIKDTGKTYTHGLAVTAPDGTIKSAWINDLVPLAWKVVGYEENKYALFYEIELPNGERKRLMLRDYDGNYKF